MKFLSCIYSLLLLSSCSLSDEFEFDEPVSQHVNICVLGNSFSNDSFSYIPFILREYGITCKIHIYYRGSGSLHDLDVQWNDAKEVGLADLDGKNHVRRHYSIDTRYTNKWQQDSIMSANDIVKIDKWDIVSLQQGGNRAKDPNTYTPYLGHIINRIDSLCPYEYDLTWFMAYNGSRDNKLEGANMASLETQKMVVESYPFDLAFPVATAVFNCQKTDSLSILGDSYYKKMYSSDDTHLQEGLPCYAAALSIAEAILRKYKPECSVMGNSTRPTASWLKSINSITPNGSSTGVTEYNCNLAQRIAIYANDNKFEIGFEE